MMRQEESLPFSEHTLSKKSLLRSADEHLQFSKINSNVKLLQYEYYSRKDETKYVDLSKTDNYIFIFNAESTISFLVEKEQRIILPKFSSLIYYGDGKSIEFEAKMNKKYKFVAVLVKAESLKYMIGNCQSKDLIDFLEYPSLNYKGETSLKCINFLDKIENSHSFIEVSGYLMFLISSTIEQFLMDQKNKEMLTTDMKSWEIEALKKITAEILDNPSHPFSVPQISEKTGISIPRLQQGFKEMHGLTVSLFIREVRLEAAERMIRDLDYNISQIVYSIGLTSRSYFSRIFKAKYKCSPSSYQKRYGNLNDQRLV